MNNKHVFGAALVAASLALAVGCGPAARPPACDVGFGIYTAADVPTDAGDVTWSVQFSAGAGGGLCSCAVVLVASEAGGTSVLTTTIPGTCK